MKRTTLILMLLILTLAALLAGCAEKPAPAESTQAITVPQIDTTAAVPETTKSVPEAVDVEAIYAAGMNAINSRGGEQLMLLPETKPEFLEVFFPGITSIPMSQYRFAMSPVTNGPVEVDLVQVRDEKDVQKVIDIFQARVDSLSEDTGYPENAAAWKNNSRITSRGRLVILAVLTDAFGEIPEEFILN